MTEVFFFFSTFDSQDSFLYFVYWKFPIIKLGAVVCLCSVTLAPSSESTVIDIWSVTSARARRF